MNTFYVRYIFCSIALWLLLSSCGSMKEELDFLPEEDGQSVVYYWTGNYHTDGGELRAYKPSAGGIDAGDKVTLSRNLKYEPSSSQAILIEPAISSNGNYVAGGSLSGDTRANRYDKSKHPFWVYDLNKAENDRRSETALSCISSGASPYMVPWSLIGNNYYIVVSDTIKKCTPDGKQSVLAYAEGVTFFSISPSEHYLFFANQSAIAVIDLDMNAVVRVKEFGDDFLFGSQHCLRTAGWSPDESRVAVASGVQIWVMDMKDKQNIIHKVNDEVYAIEWTSDSAFTYVAGYDASENMMLKDEPYFALYSYSVSSRMAKLLHKRMNHEPLSVKPKLSPSGKLLLFSEKDIDGTYQVKLMTTDGKSMVTVCNGYAPVWRR